MLTVGLEKAMVTWAGRTEDAVVRGELRTADWSQLLAVSAADPNSEAYLLWLDTFLLRSNARRSCSDAVLCLGRIIVKH